MTSSTSSAASGSTYERMSGGCTRIIALEMIRTASPPITASSYILDNACGPGIVSKEIKEQHPEARIMATDLSPMMIEEVQQQINSKGWSNMQTETLDIRSLSSLSENSFTHVFTNLGIPIPGDPDGALKAAREIYRVLHPGGVAMLSTWADRVWLAAFIRTAQTVRPHETPKNAMALEPHLMQSPWLLEQLEAAGFRGNVEVKSCETNTSARTLDELVENMMLAKQVFFAGYSDEELGRAKLILEEELQGLRTYEDMGYCVKIGMKAWIGVGWKRGGGEISL